MTNRINSSDMLVIKHHLMTEKTNTVSESNQIVFLVDRKSTKDQIKRAVEELFNVKVKAVNTLIQKGKNKVFKGRQGMRSDVKKAYVRLEDGHKIELGAGV
jgi:large subunit ribosomal protein L23